MNRRLDEARARRRRAMEACPHWDYESNGSGHACCDELDAAERAVDAARAAADRQKPNHAIVTAPVDALAVMARCASRHDCAGDYGHAEELRAALAAVRELADAARELLAHIDDRTAYEATANQARIRRALANVSQN
jgi:hypothetical protein